ncbi:hypothetical protein EYF80_056269 [Liparis tanakae]|uniref:Uncharacterized protein n=1 Tax=Liparis tanakae TaxID=230148 RepID=A0A4Z2EZB7_9TELE|nr:hypothetical protein EYF80_056269 [Liparis tanakae]
MTSNWSAPFYGASDGNVHQDGDWLLLKWRPIGQQRAPQSFAAEGLASRSLENTRTDRLTDDDRVVVGDEHLAVHVDELRHQPTLQLRVSPQAREGDVVHPMVVHWEGRGGEEERDRERKRREREEMR